jgi:hypothetical protein
MNDRGEDQINCHLRAGGDPVQCCLSLGERPTRASASGEGTAGHPRTERFIQCMR